MERIRLGIVGGGTDSLIGVLHRYASHAFERYEIICGCFSPEKDVNESSGDVYGVSPEKVYKDLDTMIAEELKLPTNQRVEVISVLTPNFLHYPMSKKLIENGIHVICEKPMTTNYEEAKSLKESLTKNPVVFALTHTYTGYPMTRQIREMVKEGAIGKIQKIDVQYYQGWINPIIHNKEKRNATWRLDPKKAGLSCCLGDIGVHAFNMVEFTTGLKIDKVLADINTLYDDNKMDIDVNVLLRFSKNVKGTLRCSQIATGEENNLRISIYGNNGYLKWEQEQPNFLYYAKEGEAVRVLKSGNTYNSKLSQDSCKLPSGHPEGIFDAMGNIYNGVAKAIRKEPYNNGEFPTLEDGIRGMYFIEQAITSNQNNGSWENIDC